MSAVQPLDFASLCSLLKKWRQRKALITFHSVGDRDGVASAIALSHCFENAVVATPDFITGNSKRMLSEASYAGSILPEFPGDVEIAIVTDANRLDILGAFGERLKTFSGSVLFLDHHALPEGADEVPNSFIFNDEGYNSASSITYEVLKAMGIQTGRSISILLLNGIIADSANLQNANALTFRQIADLFEASGLTYADVSEYFHEASSATHRQRLMQDLFSSKLEVISKYLLVYGEASSHANTAAEKMLELGADASVFWVIREKEVSISARLRQSLDRRLGIHLGRIMEDAAKHIDGTGGGHPCAAGAYGPSKEKAKDAYAYVINMLRKKLAA